MGRSPGDRDGIVALHLIKKGVDAGDDLLVGNRFDGAGCEQFDAVEAVGDEIVARCGSGVEEGASSPDPVQGMIEGAELPRVAGGTPSAYSVASCGRCGDWAPDGSGLRSARESDVNSPSCRAIWKGRAVCK